MALRFLKNFTEDLNRRFNTTALDVAPRQFDESKVIIVSDIENVYKEHIQVTYFIQNELIINGTFRSWTYRLAAFPGLEPPGSAGTFKYDLSKLQKVTMESYDLHGLYVLGGGTGSITMFLFLKVNGANFAPDTVFNRVQIGNTIAATTGSSAFAFQDETRRVIYNGNVLNLSGTGTGGGLQSPQFIAPQLFIEVPNTMPDALLNLCWVVVNFELQYQKEPSEQTREQIALI